ncbi:MAG: NADH-quinone oxidoreductase subunit D [Candidatus Latescibacteria bacterium]|jgi:NADH-quinone oxidoreductase subunit D|nr:NADH-quinone oxidoreductase subunit D [Candidatus Latescibacterota bacterium]MDP7449465.1 NADH-quinone oxidoreductase subunit D [Candidatus Latescibacterota bacterium]HJP30526.1 NADH-quinone oxidoreductase subunit D [Candidatus Latescibacterota bacterium]
MTQPTPSMELVRDAADPDTYYMNMGPQHPSTHGVLRLRLHMEGERILEAEAVIGYGHRAHEKMAENRDYLQFLPNTSRIDYLSGMIYNLGYCQAIEKAMQIEVPERAEYIRIIAGELNRITSHLLWFGTYLLDLGGITPFLYAFDDREKILDILDLVTGSRLTYSYGRFGGVSMDVDDEFLQATADFCTHFRQRITEYHTLVTHNVIFRHRTKGVGDMGADLARDFGVTGPCLRAAGVARDVRKDEPYGIYDRFDFDIVTAEEGDCFARHMVRMGELEQSLNIIEQAVRDIPDGPVMAPKVPKRIRLPEGEHYFAVESGRGHFGMYLCSDGTDVPVRSKLRVPSFVNVSTMPSVLRGTMLADTVAILGSIDVVIPEIDR